MKLSKKQLEDFIVGSISDCEEYGLSDKQERAALEALRNGTLEIEGYERNQWTRFDPNDPKTFPPKCDFLGYFDHGGINDFQYVCIRDDEDTDEAIATQAIFPRLKYWRPLPQPPGKEAK